MAFGIVATITTVFILHAVATELNCEDGWQYNLLTDKCYRFYDEEQSWPQAEIYCQFKAAHHLSVHSPQDILFIRNLVANSQAENIWIGAAQFGLSKEYENVDKTPFDYESWLYGVRPTYDENKRCIMMNARTGFWSHSCCKIPAAYVCIKDARLPSHTTTVPWYFTTTFETISTKQTEPTIYPQILRSTQNYRF